MLSALVQWCKEEPLVNLFCRLKISVESRVQVVITRMGHLETDYENQCGVFSGGLRGCSGFAQGTLRVGSGYAQGTLIVAVKMPNSTPQ